jgi:dTDP-4-amino-4,6-dideoxygalactose transaminase
MTIPFTRSYQTGREAAYLQEALAGGQLAGNGAFGQRCSRALETLTGSARIFLTGSGTHALEMAFLLLDLQPGDEVIMPSFTFASCANAVALRGGVPVFIDIRPDTLNIDAARIEAAITPRTRAILPMHYAGISCEMAAIVEIAQRRGLVVVEDAAHAIGASGHGKPLGSIGALGAFSFHQTKNLSVGEAGALLVNDPALVERAEIAWEKGTDRLRFARGEVDKYRWVDLGSSWLASELVAAPLLAQIEALDTITERRRTLWQRYHEGFEAAERAGHLSRPTVPAGCRHNGHIYYLMLRDERARDALKQRLAEQDISAVFHYVPLHSSPAGLRHGRASGSLAVTDSQAARLLRLPLYVGLSDAECDRVIDAVLQAID